MNIHPPITTTKTETQLQNEKVYNKKKYIYEKKDEIKDKKRLLFPHYLERVNHQDLVTH
jgi:hypothetical protein